MQKKYLNFLLITVAFIIWMVIFYQFVFDDNNEEDYLNIQNNKSEQVIVEEYKENLEQYFSKSAIDPFITPYNNTPAMPKETKLASNSQNIPRLQLLGILSDKEGPMAIIGFTDNSIQFVRENQKIDKFTFTDIGINEVNYKFEKLKQTIRLE